MGEWIRYSIAVVLLIAGLAVSFVSFLGVYRFRFVLNRMHAASLNDTLALMLVMAALIVAMGLRLATLKLVLVVVFMWMAGPISSHLLCKLELSTDEEMDQHAATLDRREHQEGEEQ
ncbi:MAG: monovalent cation/H(+) antiporter subunit G [Ruminococcaceae bacterium]|nr:monovalent cation/H(+) antiporter subunit G [Oscillospiraceae bacterium]